MNSNNRDPISGKNAHDTVLFLGAGFSCAAEMPTMAQFGKASLKELRSLEKENNRRPSTPLLITAGRVFDEFRQFCENAGQYVSFDPDNMESLYCLAESLQESGRIDLPYDSRYGITSVGALIDNIRIWLWKIYQRCPLTYKSADLDEPYRTFANLFTTSSIASRTMLLTTNYDLLVEHSLWRAGVSCRYPEMGQYPLAVQSGVKESYLSDTDDVDKPIVCKLHGSVNYFELGSTGELHIARDLAGLPNLSGGYLQGYDGSGHLLPTCRAAILALNAIHIVRQMGSYVPAIIPPTYAKLAGTQWLRRTWGRALDGLASASVLVFIGYSMPESDGFIRSLIHSAMACRKRRDLPKVYVFDPEARRDRTTGRRYLNTFSPLADDLRLIDKSFGVDVCMEIKDIVGCA